MRIQPIHAVLLGAALLAGCGTPGAPQPPSLRLPKPVDDLTITRKGGQAHLSWTLPHETTDGQAISKFGAVRVCRAPGHATVSECGQPLATLQAPAASPDNKPLAMTYDDAVAAGQSASDFAIYAIEVQNASGRSSGLSNQVYVPLAPVGSAPARPQADISADAIAISWNAPRLPRTPGVRFYYRLNRSTAGKPPVAMYQTEGTGQSAFLDRNFEWGQSYAYTVTPVTRVLDAAGKVIAEIEGEDSPPVQVTPKDTFAPETPGGVQAVYSGQPQQPFVDLTWRPNTEPDLAGYNVYRREGEGQAPAKLNSALVKTPSYRDSTALPGHTYDYFVSAVDVRGNQSALSQETEESVPK